jgi:hypothetical protein
MSTIERIDWDNPPKEMACTGCGVVQPTIGYPRVSGGYRARRHPAQRSRRCHECTAADMRERARRKYLSARQLLLRGEDAPITPTRTDSALAEAGIAAELYAQALRALATSPPVPVWEREEWA